MSALPLKALTLWQPWAWAILYSDKRIENRPWPPPIAMIGRTIVLHASRQYSVGTWNWPKDVPQPKRSECVLGALVGTARIETILDRPEDAPMDQRRWWAGPFGWLLGEVRRLPEPIPCRGRQKLWNLDDELEGLVYRGLAT